MATVSRKIPKTASNDLVPLPSDIVAEVSESFESAEAPAAEFRHEVEAAAENAVTETRVAFVKAKVSPEEAANAIEKSYTAARDGVIAINAKAFEALRANAEANFDFVKAVLGVKSLGDLVALQSEFARKQADALSGQTKELGALTQKTVAETFQPLKDQVAKSFKIAV